MLIGPDTYFVIKKSYFFQLHLLFSSLKGECKKATSLYVGKKPRNWSVWCEQCAVACICLYVEHIYFFCLLFLLFKQSYDMKLTESARTTKLNRFLLV
jgi:hypothetical protein